MKIQFHSITNMEEGCLFYTLLSFLISLFLLNDEKVLRKESKTRIYKKMKKIEKEDDI